MGGALSKPRPIDTAAGNTATAAADTVVTKTISGIALKSHVMAACLYSYSETPVGGNITVKNGAVTVLDLDIIAGGPGEILVPLRMDVAADLVVTLAAGGGTAVGTLNVYHYADVSQ